MAGIVPGLVGERIVLDRVLELIGRTDEERRAEVKGLREVFFEQALESRWGSVVRAEDDVAALEQGSDVLHTEVANRGREILHRDVAVAREVHGAQESDIRRHFDCSLCRPRNYSSSRSDATPPRGVTRRRGRLAQNEVTS